MYIMSKHVNNRAVANIIAALLLIAIAVAAAVLLYVFSIGLLGSLGSSGGQQTKEQVIMEAYAWTGGCGTSLVITLRNVGPAAANLGTGSGNADFFVNGAAITGASGGTTSINPGGSTAVTLPTTGVSPCVNGAAYPLKIVTPVGSVFSYSVIAGSGG
jgi:flagellin-like protein